VRYWDTSAIVPLVVAEPSTSLVRGWYARDPHIVTWAWTRVEIASAVERRSREGHLTAVQRREALDRFEALADSWDEITDVIAVRVRAVQLLARHAIRAADSAQLGAALLVADPDPAEISFICLDERLATAADREGFRVLSPR
jgi:predicted nucleic acid-binding protein